MGNGPKIYISTDHGTVTVFTCIFLFNIRVVHYRRSKGKAQAFAGTWARDSCDIRYFEMAMRCDAFKYIGRRKPKKKRCYKNVEGLYSEMGTASVT